MKELISARFAACFDGSEPQLIVRSPGRVNIIGEHTDYNQGFVLPAAIDKAAYLAISPRADQEIRLAAYDLNERFQVSLHDLQPLREISWPNYILGAVAQFRKRGIVLSGFNALLCSDVPIGAGLSSSAAVECATTFAINELSGSGLDRLTMVEMAQKAEHEFAGVLCGIMDQFASMMGQCGQVIKLDCRSLEYEYLPFQLQGLKILLLNTNVKHSLANSAYNERRQECQQAVDWINEMNKNVGSLRDVTEADLDAWVLPRNQLIDKRARFVVREIDRLQGACNDLRQGNITALGRKMFATHEGLSRDYEVSCPELDFLVNQVKKRKEVKGARMMGGGFGGCTINLVEEPAIENLVSDIKTAYERETGLSLTYYIASIENGTGLIG